MSAPEGGWQKDLAEITPQGVEHTSEAHLQPLAEHDVNAMCKNLT